MIKWDGSANQSPQLHYLPVECRADTTAASSLPFDENVLELFSWFVICRCPDNLSPVDIDLHGEDHCLASYLGFYCFYQKKLGRDFGQHFSMCQLCPARLSSAGLKCDHGSAPGPHQLKYCILSQEPYLHPEAFLLFLTKGTITTHHLPGQNANKTWTTIMSKSNNWDQKAIVISLSVVAFIRTI